MMDVLNVVWTFLILNINKWWVLLETLSQIRDINKLLNPAGGLCEFYNPNQHVNIVMGKKPVFPKIIHDFRQSIY